MRQQKKKAAKAKVDQAVTEAKGHINEAINNSGVDEAKTNGTTTINAIQPEVIKNQKQDKQLMMLQELKKKRLIKHRVQQQKKRGSQSEGRPSSNGSQRPYQ